MVIKEDMCCVYNNTLQQATQYNTTMLGLPGITLVPFSLSKIKTSSFSIQNPNTSNTYEWSSSSRAAALSFFQSSPSRNNYVHISRAARRRSVRHDTDEEDDEEEEYGHNQEIAMIEAYSQSVREEALIVHALVDADLVQVLIFKGFSSSLSYETWADPSRSILPATAEIKWIDRVKGPFDPSNIHYIDKHISWQTFKSNFLANL